MGLMLVVVGGYESIVCSCKEKEGYKYEKEGRILNVKVWCGVGETGIVDAKEYICREVNVEGEKRPMMD